jgi:predicted aldo/keto reductase-like oxidoreductase
MLSYLLANEEVNGVKSVEQFRSKFADDPATFMMIDRSTRSQTETILFNIDIEGSMNKDKTAVLRVFAKMFYNHLGFNGDDLKIAMLEKAGVNQCIECACCSYVCPAHRPILERNNEARAFLKNAKKKREGGK